MRSGRNRTPRSASSIRCYATGSPSAARSRATEPGQARKKPGAPRSAAHRAKGARLRVTADDEQRCEVADVLVVVVDSEVEALEADREVAGVRVAAAVSLNLEVAQLGRELIAELVLQIDVVCARNRAAHVDDDPPEALLVDDPHLPGGLLQLVAGRRTVVVVSQVDRRGDLRGPALRDRDGDADRESDQRADEHRDSFACEPLHRDSSPFDSDE